MRLPFFTSDERRAALQQECDRWKGTRWMHCGTRPNDPVPGVAGDCFAWVHILKAVGQLPADFQLPHYRRFEAISGPAISALQGGIEASGYFLPLPADAPLLVGDIVLLKTGNGGGHAGDRTPDAATAYARSDAYQNAINDLCDAFQTTEDELTKAAEVV